MSEVAEISGFNSEATERSDERELIAEGQRKPQSEEEWILFDLTGRYDVDKAPPVSFLEAITLIKAVEKDLEERGGYNENYDDKLEDPEKLELTRRALVKASDGTQEYTRGEMRTARAYFKWKRDYWTNNNDDFPQEYTNKLRRIYGDVLRQLNEKMPVPESVLPYPPSEPGFLNMKTILKPLFDVDSTSREIHLKETLGEKDVLDCFNAMKKDIEDQQAPIGIMRIADDKARTFFNAEGLAPDDRVCVVVIEPDEQTVRIERYQNKPYSQLTADKRKQFIFDMTDQHPYNNDGLYTREFDFYDNLSTSAQRAVSAIQTLFENPSQFDEKEVTDVTVGLARLDKFVDLKDEIQKDAVKKLIDTVKVKWKAAGMIVPSEPELVEAN